MIIPLVLAVILVLSVALTLTLRKDKLEGTWLYGTTQYRFDGKGRGEMKLAQKVYPYGYQLKKGVLTLDFQDPDLSDPTYSISLEGSRLTLTDSGMEYELRKEVQKGD